MKLALLLTASLAAGVSAETPAPPAQTSAAAQKQPGAEPGVESGAKELGTSMSHWALLCPPDSADPRLRQFSERLGDLRQRLDRKLDAKSLKTLKQDFEAWKNELSSALYASHGSGDAAKFRAQLENGLHAVAALSEKSHVTEKDVKGARAQVAVLKRALGAAQADYLFEKAAPKGGVGELAAARRAGETGAERLYAGYRAPNHFSFVGQPRVVRPEQAKAPAAPTDVELSSARPSDSDLLAYVTKHWGFSTAFAWLVIKTSHGFGVDPRITLSMMKQESSGKADAKSYKGASGLMQLMPGTAAWLGVKNIWDVEQNVWGGVKYVAYLTRQMAASGYHGLKYVLAAYNAGPGAVYKYHGLPAYRETMGYVASITANYTELASRVPARG